MSTVAELDRRVTSLEGRMDDVEKLARGTGQEVADWRATLNNHTKLLNAMGEKIDLFQKQVNGRFEKVETEMRDGFTLLHRGQDQITQLLTRALGETDDGMTAGGADD